MSNGYTFRKDISAVLLTADKLKKWVDVLEEYELDYECEIRYVGGESFSTSNIQELFEDRYLENKSIESIEISARDFEKGIRVNFECGDISWRNSISCSCQEKDTFIRIRDEINQFVESITNKGVWAFLTRKTKMSFLIKMFFGILWTIGIFTYPIKAWAQDKTAFWLIEFGIVIMCSLSYYSVQNICEYFCPIVEFDIGKNKYKLRRKRFSWLVTVIIIPFVISIVATFVA